MPTIFEMAQAHLSNVQKAMTDLQAQKNNVEQEIAKLTAYFEEGLVELKKETSASKQEAIVVEDV